MKKSFLFLLLFFGPYLYGQNCNSNAGENMEVCGGLKVGSRYKVFLDGSGSNVDVGTIEYEWVSVGDAINLRDDDESDPWFYYPTDLTQDTDYTFELTVSNGTCEDVSTVVVTVKANMCPFPDAGDDLVASNGCDVSISLDGSDSSDPQGDDLSYTWELIEGTGGSIANASSSIATFTFPGVSQTEDFIFSLSVNDGEHIISDTMVVSYLNNSAPVADAGQNFNTCNEYFLLTASNSYDEEWNSLTYKWISLDSSFETYADPSPKDQWNLKNVMIKSPTNLDVDTDYAFRLEVTETISGEEHCVSSDLVTVTIEKNICPIAEAGKDRRIPKFDNRSIVLNAANSRDPDGVELSYVWIAPNGSEVNNSLITVEDLDKNSRYTKYNYKLKVTDIEGAISEDSVQVIFSDFSAPDAPEVFAVANHNRVLVSWDASSESAIDSLTGYADFEGYKLYRSTDGGLTWGGNEDKLFDFDGNFVGWVPYAQFDLSYAEDYNHCIYTNEDCGSEEPRRNTSIYGLDPLAPRFIIGTNSGIEYSFIDSNVVDGIEYTYTVCAYDMGLEPFYIDYIQDEGGETFSADTIWADTNPDKFLGPRNLDYFDVFGNLVRTIENETGGYPYLESKKGVSVADKNFITVLPGYTASNISFPDENDIEAIFASDSSNIGTGSRKYFIVDRDKISSEKLLKYQIKADQGVQAIDGIAVENPELYVYEINQDGLPQNYQDPPYDIDLLNFFEKDSLTKLPGASINDFGELNVPEYQLVQPLGKWSNMMDGIRFKFDNGLSLDGPPSPPIVPQIDIAITNSDGSAFDSLQYVQWYFIDFIQIYMEYADNAYERRLNMDYEIEFFSEPVGDQSIPDFGNMGFPFRITNLYTGKKVDIICTDYGSNNEAGDNAESDGDLDNIWTRGEEILMLADTVSINGEEKAQYNFNLFINYSIFEPIQNRLAWKSNREYTEKDTVFYGQMLWASLGISNDQPPSSDEDSPWRPIYPWKGGEKYTIQAGKFFENGDNWTSDMSVLGKVLTVEEATLDEIKVVPNPYVVRSRFNESPTSRKMRFTNLPQDCRITIFTVTGEVVRVLDHSSQFDGNEWWDLRTGNNQEVAPGLYIYHVESQNGKEKVGKFAVIR